jgi:hypothetical protein
MKKRYIALMITAGVVLGALVGTVATFELQTPKIITKAVAAVTPPPERIEVTRVAMVKALEGKLEITSASMRLEKYVPGGVCNSFLWEDCVTVIVSGKINAGFDWGSFTPHNIRVTPDEVTVHLGKPKIHDVVIDHTRTKTISQEDGLFVLTPDKSLQLRTIARTVDQLKVDACHNGILKFAALEAEKRVGANLRTLLKAAGDTRTVSIVYDIPRC